MARDSEARLSIHQHESQQNSDCRDLHSHYLTHQAEQHQQQHPDIMEECDSYPSHVSQLHHPTAQHHQQLQQTSSDFFWKSSNGSTGMTPAKPRRASASSSINNQSSSNNSSTTPICRCRVIYLGSAVPHITKDGLQGIQEPLRDLYPDNGTLQSQDTEAIGIDSWLSVWSNGILIENVDGSGREVKRFFPIESLHYCAAVRYVVIPNHESSAHNSTSFATFHGNTVGRESTNTLKSNGHSSNLSHKSPVTDLTESGRLKKSASEVLNPSTETVDTPSGSSSSSNNLICQPQSLPNTTLSSKIKFLPLDSPFSRNSNVSLHPPLFACILRRTTGIKVLECHAFICKRDQAANALVRCCFHAYADSMHAKQMEQELLESQSNYTSVRLDNRTEGRGRGTSGSGGSSNNRSNRINGMSNGHHNQHNNQPNGRFSRSISDLDSVENKIEAWRQRSTEALNKEGLHNDNIEVIVKKGMRHDPNIDNDIEEDDDDERPETSFVSQRDSAATRVRNNRRRRASSANNDHRLDQDDDDDDHDPDDDNYKVWAGNPANHGNRLPGAHLSASTPHLHHLRQNSAPHFIDPETGRGILLAAGHHHPHPTLHHHSNQLLQPVVLHDGRGTLRSVRTTASSVHHPQFRPPSVSSRSMINLHAPHRHVNHVPLTPPHHPLGFHVIHGPPPGHPAHMPGPPIMAGPPPGHFPFPPVPTTLSKKQLKSLKSSMKKLHKKSKGMIPPPDFVINGRHGPVPPPFLRGGPIPPHAMPMLVRGHPPPHLIHPIPPPMHGRHMHPHTMHHHPIEEPIYAPQSTSRPMTPVSGSALQGRRSSLHQQAIQPIKHDSDEHPSDSSIFNNGIYRKRANLNEKAFSHSIRQESQSRSGSVQNVQQFSDNENSGPASLGGQFKANGRLGNGHHHPMIMSSNHNEDVILAQSLENVHLSNGKNAQSVEQQGNSNGCSGGSKLMMLMKQRNGNNSTTSESSVHSSSQQTKPHLHNNYTNGVGHLGSSTQDSITTTIANQGNNSNNTNNSSSSGSNFKTASIKRGSGSSLQYHLHNTNGVVH